MPTREELRVACASPTLLFAAAVVLASAGCSSDAARTPRIEPVVDSVGGVPRLRYPESGAPELAWSLDTVAVVGGSREEDPLRQFAGAGRPGLAGDETGNLYLLDSDGRRVLAFGPEGASIGRWGREGSGPGELGGGMFGGPVALALGPGDTLWIDDRTNQRFTLFPARGGEPTTVPRDMGTDGLVGQISVDSGGIIALRGQLAFAPGSAGESPPAAVVRMTRAGQPIDTLWVAPPPPERNVVTWSAGNGRTPMMMLPPVFTPGFSWVRLAGGGFAVQEAAGYEIHLLDEGGATRRIIRRDPPPRPVTEADRRRYLDDLLAPPEEENPFNTEAARRAQAEATTFAAVVPRIIALRSDSRNRLWVGVSKQDPWTIARIDVYDVEGELLGELRGVPMPDRFYGDGRAVLLDEDELGVQRITLVRLVEPDGR